MQDINLDDTGEVLGVSTMHPRGGRLDNCMEAQGKYLNDCIREFNIYVCRSTMETWSSRRADIYIFGVQKNFMRTRRTSQIRTKVPDIYVINFVEKEATRRRWRKSPK